LNGYCPTGVTATNWNYADYLEWSTKIYFSLDNKDYWIPGHDKLISKTATELQALYKKGKNELTNKDIYYPDTVGDEYKYSYLNSSRNWVHLCDCGTNERNQKNTADTHNGFTNCKCSQSERLKSDGTCEIMESTCYNNGNNFDMGDPHGLEAKAKIGSGGNGLYMVVDDSGGGSAMCPTGYKQVDTQEECEGAASEFLRAGVPGDGSGASWVSAGHWPDHVRGCMVGGSGAFYNGNVHWNTNHTSPGQSTTAEGHRVCVSTPPGFVKGYKEGEFWNIMDPWCNLSEDEDLSNSDRCCTSCAHKVYDLKDSGEINYGIKRSVSENPDYAINWYDQGGSESFSKLQVDSIYDPILNETDLPRKENAAAGGGDPLDWENPEYQKNWRENNLALGFNSRPIFYYPKYNIDAGDVPTIPNLENTFVSSVDGADSKDALITGLGTWHPSTGWESARDDNCRQPDGCDEVRNYKLMTSNIFTCRRTNTGEGITEGDLDIPPFGVVGDEIYSGVLGSTVSDETFRKAHATTSKDYSYEYPGRGWIKNETVDLLYLPYGFYSYARNGYLSHNFSKNDTNQFCNTNTTDSAACTGSGVYHQGKRYPCRYHSWGACSPPIIPGISWPPHHQWSPNYHTNGDDPLCDIGGATMDHLPDGTCNPTRVRGPNI
jgi:hypothetical protein